VSVLLTRSYTSRALPADKALIMVRVGPCRQARQVYLQAVFFTVPVPGRAYLV